MTELVLARGELTDGQYRRRAVIAALLLITALLIAGLSAARPASASSSAPSVSYAFTLNGYNYYKVCAPARCVTTKSYYPAGTAGQVRTYKPWPSGVYCSSSVGCFTYQGVNYSYNGGPKPNSSQTIATRNCAVGLGFTWASTLAGGPLGFLLGGIALTVWGCSGY